MKTAFLHRLLITVDASPLGASLRDRAFRSNRFALSASAPRAMVGF